MRIADPYDRDRYRNRNSISEEEMLPARHIMLDNLAAGITQEELTYLVDKAAVNGVRVNTFSPHFKRDIGPQGSDSGIGGY